LRRKRYTLLCHGNRDGFGARTLTLTQDTEGNIFGSFTPLASDSVWGHTADSVKSFLFTLKKPHNFTAMQTLTVPVFSLMSVTQTTPAWTGRFSSRVCIISQ
jgi:hypothetical protein